MANLTEGEQEEQEALLKRMLKGQDERADIAARTSRRHLLLTWTGRLADAPGWSC